MIATFTVVADIARNVAGDLIQVQSLTKPGSQIHGYEPTASDVARVAEAQLVLVNGLGLDDWMDRLLGTTGAPRIVVSEGVTPEFIRSGEHDGQVNPHAWMSPANGALYANAIARAFAELDPVHGDVFAHNAATYGVRLMEVADRLRSGLAELAPPSQMLVTCEDAFSYLTSAARVSEAYLWAVNSESQATPRQVAAVVDQVRASSAPAVFCESTVSDAAQRQIAADTGARFGGTLYVDSLSQQDGPVPTYLALLDTDARTIVAGLSGEEGR